MASAGNLVDELQGAETEHEAIGSNLYRIGTPGDVTYWLTTGRMQLSPPGLDFNEDPLLRCAAQECSQDGHNSNLLISKSQVPQLGRRIDSTR